MNPLVSTLILIGIALIGARLSFSSRWVPPGPALVFRTGTHFLFFGFLLGPHALGLFTPESVEQLFPFLALGLGWVGFLFGLQLGWDTLRHFPWTYPVIVVVQGVLTFGIFLACGMWGLRLVGLTEPEHFLLLLVASATASVATPAAVAMVSSNFMVRGRVHRLLLFIASLDAVVGIVALQLTYAGIHPSGSIPGLGAIGVVGWTLLAVVLGIVCGLIFLWLTQPRAGKDDLALFLMGITAFGSGAALMLQLSPLFVSMTTGAIVANLARDRDRIFEALQKWEKQIYVVLLLLSGVLLDFPTLWILPLALGYAVVRAGAKVAGNAVAAAFAPIRTSKLLGTGLISQGGISLAMAAAGVLILSDLAWVGEDAVDIFFSSVVIGVVLSELVGPFFTIRLFRRNGVISTKVEEALARGDEAQARREALRTSVDEQSGEDSR